jgi:hypothetical protein
MIRGSPPVVRNSDGVITNHRGLMLGLYPIGGNQNAPRPVTDHGETRPVEWHGLIPKLAYQIQLCMSKRGAFVLAGRDVAIEVLHQVERVNVARSPKARDYGLRPGK